MAKRPSGRPDPMAREVDRLLAQLARASTDSEQERSTSHGNGGSPRPTSRGDLAALWGRVLLGAGLGVLMTQWPYSHACDLPLLGYLCAVGMVLLAGGWVAFESWRLRHGPAHIVSLILLFWGIVLAAEQLLPRIGYAAEPARWRCAAVTPSGTPSAAAPARTAAGRAR
jgi:hypothetical protein